MIKQLSVVMPAYNAMPYLKPAIESILDQTFRDFEFLIVDDGSTDDSGAYLESLSDPRIRIVHQKRGGIEAALNTGIREARHDWIARMDGDDVALPTRLEKEVNFLERNPQYSLISCAIGYVGGNGRRLRATFVPQLSSPPIYQPMVDPMIADQGMVFRRDAVQAVGGYRVVGAAEGLDLLLRLDEAGYLMTSIPDALMLVRVLSGGVSARKFVDQRVTWKYSRACRSEQFR